MTIQTPRILIGFALALGIATLSAQTTRGANPGNPAEFPTAAAMRILSLITISEDDNLDFGRIIPPISGTQDFEVGTDNSMTPGLGNGQAVDGHSRGQYDIMGTGGEFYTLTVQTGVCTNVNLVLAAVGSDAVSPTTLNEVNLHIGGTLNVGSSVPPGSYTCNYVITAEY